MWLKIVLALLSLSTATSELTINCDYDNGSMKEFSVPYYYRCRVTDSVVTREPNETITSITGTHLFGFTSNDEVIYIEFHSKQVPYVPRLENQFVNIKIFAVFNSDLQAIEKFDLQQLPKLELLFLQRNNLKSLKKGLFDSNTKLRGIFFSNNKLSSVGIDLLKPLKQLEFAHFENNLCTQMNAEGTREIEQLAIKLNEDCHADSDDYETEKKQENSVSKIKNPMSLVGVLQMAILFVINNI